MSLPPLECLMKLPLASHNSPLKASVHFKPWTLGWTKDRTNIKWANTEREKKKKIHNPTKGQSADGQMK